MGLATRYLHVYEYRVMAADVKSGKLVSNIFYFRNKTQTAGAALAYGDDIPSSLNTTWAAKADTAWVSAAGPNSIMSVNYAVSGSIARDMVGRRWRSPVIAITAIVPLLAGGCAVVFTTPIVLAVGDLVYMSGIASPSNLNGVFPVDQVMTPTEIRLTTTPIGTWGGSGSIQAASGAMDWLYDDKVEFAFTDTGDIAGEAAPLFCTASVRRLNVGVGRNWKSRVSMSPLGESQMLNGKLTSGAVTAINAAFAEWYDPGIDIDNGGVGVGDASKMEHVATSKQIAFTTPSPYTESETWAKKVTSFAVRPNNGSFTRRKPKLTAVIA